MKKGTIYELATGRVTMTVIAPDEEGIHIQIIEKQDTHGVIMNSQLDSATQYVVDRFVVDRPEFPVTLPEEITIGVNEVWRVEGIPPGTKLRHPESIDQIDDGEIEWSSIEPGEFHFEFDNFPMQLVKVVVKVV